MVVRLTWELKNNIGPICKNRVCRLHSSDALWGVFELGQYLAWGSEYVANKCTHEDPAHELWHSQYD